MFGGQHRFAEDRTMIEPPGLLTIKFFSRGAGSVSCIRLDSAWYGGRSHRLSFPGSEALKVDDQICVANYVEKFDTWRITLSAREINQLLNCVSGGGADKAATLHDVPEDISA
jgi:hypothetical protein